MNVQSVKSPVAESDQKVPAPANPIDVLLAIHRRNIEAMLKAQQTIMEGNKAMMEHQMECLRSTVEQTMKAVQGIMQEPDVKTNFRKCCESMKTSMQGSTCNSNILLEVNARFNGQASQIIQNRIYEALDESGDVFDAMLDSYPRGLFGSVNSLKA